MADVTLILCPHKNPDVPASSETPDLYSPVRPCDRASSSAPVSSLLLLLHHLSLTLSFSLHPASLTPVNTVALKLRPIRRLHFPFSKALLWVSELSGCQLFDLDTLDFFFLKKENIWNTMHFWCFKFFPLIWFHHSFNQSLLTKKNLGHLCFQTHLNSPSLCLSLSVPQTHTHTHTPMGKCVWSDVRVVLCDVEFT